MSGESSHPETATEVNGIDAGELRAYSAQAAEDPSVADRDPAVVARWDGGTRSRIEYDGETIAHMNGDEEGDLNAMVMVLASLASCDVEVITTKAAFLGVEIEDLAIEARGHFNVGRLVGVDDAPSPRYEAIEYVVHLTAPDATAEEIAALEAQCEHASPVGETLGTAIPIRFEFHTD